MVEAAQSWANAVRGASLLRDLGLVGRDKALATGRDLLTQVGLGDTVTVLADRFGKLNEEIVNANRANRQLLVNLLDAELTRVAERLGFARTDELRRMRREIAELQASVARLRASSDAPA